MHRTSAAFVARCRRDCDWTGWNCFSLSYLRLSKKHHRFRWIWKGNKYFTFFSPSITEKYGKIWTDGGHATGLHWGVTFMSWYWKEDSFCLNSPITHFGHTCSSSSGRVIGLVCQLRSQAGFAVRTYVSSPERLIYRSALTSWWRKRFAAYICTYVWSE